MTITVTAEGRVDSILASEVEGLSRSAIQKLLQEGHILLNGKPAKKNDKPSVGDEITIHLPEAEVTDLVAENIPLDVRYEDEDVIVINKPKGMVVHPAPGHASGTLVNALLYHCGESLSGIGGEKRPGIVHRIDKDTSGLIIVAKNDMAHQSLSDQLKDRSLSRTYECIAVGNFREDTGTIDAPIGRHPTDRKKMAVNAKNGRDAVTHWEVLERFTGYCHLKCKLQTGRTHQIRVHLASRSHPIAGDAVYGKTDPRLGLMSQCLHAVKLEFIHPRTGEKVEVSSPLPVEFTTALEILRSRN
ncbi:MAG: RluA family pseudouridine synthase [Oscillospiraceae bacterium]|nr:RluA family pseudouridine synthase [Oscillospiraceae bacterium]